MSKLIVSSIFISNTDNSNYSAIAYLRNDKLVVSGLNLVRDVITGELYEDVNIAFEDVHQARTAIITLLSKRLNIGNEINITFDNTQDDIDINHSIEFNRYATNIASGKKITDGYGDKTIKIPYELTYPYNAINWAEVIFEKIEIYANN